MTIIQMLFSAKGRIRRRDYWLWSILAAVVVVGTEFAGHAVLATGDFVKDMAGWITLQPTPFNILMWVLLVFGQYIGICISAKRWHDRNRSGYLAGVVSAAILITSAVEIYCLPTGAHPNGAIYFSAAAVNFVVSIWQFVECGCLDGTRGANPYGPSPKGLASQADAF